MRKLESLKIIKRMCNFKSLSNFQYHKASFDDSVIIASCLGDSSNEIFSYYDSRNGAYHLSVNFNSVTYKNFSYIFTDEFSKQVFDAIHCIFIQKECEKHDKEL